jgi:shikimate kinase
MKSNIALIGFMGVGKSAVGRVLAEKLGMQFVETDALIKEMAGKSIPDIFREDGEIAFRELEIAVIKDVALGNGQVIACGGGVVLNTINIARLRETGVIILLTATPQAIIKRTTLNKESRPLLASAQDHAQRIRALLKFRRPYYERATDITVSTSQISVAAIADAIIDRIKCYEGFSLPQ